MSRPGRSFYERRSPTVARELLGCQLVRVIDGGRLSGSVVETEAYRGQWDPASHAFRGRTERNAVMFGQAGHAYVYFTMGMHHCLNITTEQEGTAGAVLLRAIEPLEGLESMKRNRGPVDLHRIASGPGNLTEALGVDGALNGEDMVRSSELFVEQGKYLGEVGVSTRVGVTVGKTFEWRFYAKGNPFVSKGKPALPSKNP